MNGKRSNQAVGLTESNYMFGINALVPFSVGRWTSVFEGEIGRSSVAGMYNWAEQDVCQACLMAGGQARVWSM